METITDNPETKDSLEEILESNATIDHILCVKDLLTSFSGVVCILNEKDEIVFSNCCMLSQYGLNLLDLIGSDSNKISNVKVGENIFVSPGSTKGIKHLIDKCHSEKKIQKEQCRVIKNDKFCSLQLDLEFTVTPFAENRYIIISVKDITEKKRKELLERIFFHDIINIAGSLSGVLKLFPLLIAEEKEEYLKIANSLTGQIIDEIKAQQQMVKAERGELEIHPEKIMMAPFLRKIRDQVRFNQVAYEKKVEIEDHTQNILFRTDEILLTRVLINMAKNALEAVPHGGNILIKARSTETLVIFEVFNNSYMSKEVQMQLFQHFYSTKGKNRGIGTYSMKLIGERYLRGNIGFTSTAEDGTLFFIEIPISL